ncbi:LAMI_0F03972g1_1 [Lachancea mirantina]|uniref:Sulfurtransferase n=1 Tax=Lachancea mirantina TaxID=1230905 RepID=A0A1G4JXI0_9SACH|nr:LAMI_0F03972g1_1 [Lachancea mirantina]
MSLYKLITPRALQELIQKETARRVIPVDSTWYLPNANKDAKEEFLEVERIPKATYFDIDAVKDVSSPYPHMLPSLSMFNKSMSDLGLLQSDVLVVYDRNGIFSGPRCAWTFKLFGHKYVFLLNDFKAYKSMGFPLENSPRTTLSDLPPTNYNSTTDLTKEETVSFDDMLSLVQSGELSKKYNVFDARSTGRFTGQAPEPRPGLPSGHIPGSQSLPFTEVLTDGSYDENAAKIKEHLDAYIEKAQLKLDPSNPTIALCGTGVSGVIIKSALEQAGVPNVKLYDGSWTEWAMRVDPSLIAKGSN